MTEAAALGLKDPTHLQGTALRKIIDIGEDALADYGEAEPSLPANVTGWVPSKLAGQVSGYLRRLRARETGGQAND